MSFELVEEKLTLLKHWIREREQIRLRRAAGQSPPWTDDVVLKTWRFCCVDRQDDRETRWIQRHIVEPHRDSPSLWLNLVVARFVNWSPTLAKLGYFDDWDSDRFERVVGGATGKVYTGAYMVPAGPAGVPKHVYLARHVFGELWRTRDERPAGGASCSAWSGFLRRAPLVGDFLRNQIITDLKYTSVLSEAPDWATFFLPGPGTQRGLNRVYGRDVTATWPRFDDFSVAFERLRTDIRADSTLPDVFRDPNNLGNCLCEFDKYVRVLSGEGKPRSKFSPSLEPLP